MTNAEVESLQFYRNLQRDLAKLTIGTLPHNTMKCLFGHYLVGLLDAKAITQDQFRELKEKNGLK